MVHYRLRLADALALTALLIATSQLSAEVTRLSAVSLRLASDPAPLAFGAYIPAVRMAVPNSGDQFPELVDPVLVRLHEVTWEEFVVWLLTGHNRVEVRRQLESQLRMRLRAVDYVLKLSAEQREKLRLAGQGDIERFWSDVDEAYRAARDGVWTDENVDSLLQRLQLLRDRLQRGLHDQESLLAKTVNHLCRGDLEDQRPYAMHHFQHAAFRVRKLQMLMLQPPAPVARPMQRDIP